MCRQVYRSSLTLSRKIKCENNIQILLEDHRPCLFNRCPTVTKYLECLNDEWKKFAYFIFSTQSSDDYYEGIPGIQHLCFDNFRKESRLLSEGKCHVVIKTAEGKTQVAIGCMLACMSVRLVISPKDDEGIEADNEYADEAIGYMNRQLEVCWRVFPRLINRVLIEHILIRNFHNVTCSLLLIGNHDIGLCDYHFAPMKDQLGSLKKCNFEKSCFDQIRRSFPPLDRENLRVEFLYLEYGRCCSFFVENNNDDFQIDSDSEDEIGEQQDITENNDNQGAINATAINGHY